MLFRDRIEAGQRLAKELKNYAKRTNTVILALPRGGVPVAFEIAKTLQLPLDIFLVRKLGVPGQEELAMGAIASGNVTVFNEDIVQQFHISPQTIDHIKNEQERILAKRNLLYRNNQPPSKITGKTIILVDDGIATGATIRAAIKAIKQSNCEQLIVAVPIAPESTIHSLKQDVENIICLEKPEPFYAIGNWYQNFPQTSDKEVRTLLAKAKALSNREN